MNKYIKIKLTYFKLILASYLIFIFISLGITIALNYFYYSFIETGRIIISVNTGSLLLLLLSICILIPVALFSSRKVSSPILELQKIAICIAEGNFDIKADESSPGEVGNLAKALNHLSKELSNTIGSLTKERNLLKQIINSISDGLVSVDVNASITAINPAFYSLFDLKEESFLMLDEKIRSALINGFHASISSGEERTLTFHKDQKEILAQITPRFLGKEDTNSLGAVCILRDITEHTRLEQTRRDYVANVSHELRSPLTAMKGLIIPLMEGMVKDPVKVNHFYDIIYKEINRLNLMVNDLFELSRLQSNQTEILIRKVNAAQILLEQKEKYLSIAREKDIIIDTSIVSSTPYLYGNIDRLHQILTILIDNALKFTPFNGSICLSLTESDSNLVLSVSNTGSFIAPSELPHLFERFYKVDKARTSEGAGLGLSIAKELISKLQGTIEVESDIQKGTTFSICLKKA